MAVVLGLGWLGHSLVPELHTTAFWIWLVVFYLATLALEIGLLVHSAPEKQPFGGQPPAKSV
jgi:hypothetical protein